MPKTKKEKLPAIVSSQREALAKLSATAEFQSLLELFKIEENNIVVGAFKVLSSDPTIATKKAWYEGRVYELRKIIKTFEECRKEDYD